MDPMGYASIKLSRLVPSHHLPTALRPQGAPFLLATRRKTPGCGTRASPYAESQASNGSPEGTPIELQYNLGLFGDIWGLFWDYLGIIWGLFWLYFGYAIGGINKSTNSPVSSGFQAVEHGVEQHGVWKDRSSKAVLQQAQRQGPLLALVTCDYCCTKTDHVWGGLHFRHGTQKVAGNAPLASSCTCTDPGIETPSIRCQRSAPHVIQKTEGQFPESSFLTGADDRTETDRICRHFLLKHNFQQSNGTLPLVCLFAGGDGRTGGNHIPGCWSQKWVLWEK